MLQPASDESAPKSPLFSAPLSNFVLPSILLKEFVSVALYTFSVQHMILARLTASCTQS